MQVTRVQADDETAQRQGVLATGLRDAHPVSVRRTAVGRPRSSCHRAMPRVCADIAFGRVVGGRHVGTVDEERDPRLVEVEPLLEPDDVREPDEVRAADEVSEANARPLACVRIAALGGLLAGHVERDQSVAKLLGGGARGDLGDFLASRIV